ncbi:hypothetical protein CEUSTIGMA_g6999.t1 [Chlamydomonas eustigma]|uniref:Protein kinase domain-containing protein n=1 Tax=Chlamydomonas eustigma TaxID=1157962 RepID=A0A250X904_9CHLO|nr:hypothetical protein CEUSTIGMA_g6999.t1 [Chlamydomonas eustigma]|eukprot:GAX79558.1 hypothetical protein CEUSTIGMA_g6999.t1 [Chlamydomonas eustigma]
MVTAQRQTQKELSDLALEKDAVQALLQRQYKLIACISLVTDVSRSVYSKPLATELIETVQMQIANTSMAERPSRQIERLALLGSESYGKVYKGRWRDMDVAIKSMMLPYKMSGAEKSHCMAVMEAAISTSLKHPNIVKTHTYSIQPVMEQCNVEHQIDLPTLSPTHHLNTAGAEVQEARVLGLEGSCHNQAPVVRAFHIQMVLEFCDCGTLRSALNQGSFKRELPKDGSLESSCSAANSCLKGLNINYSAVLETAIDIARGMLHLHESDIVHSDLKAQNVLLQSCSNEARGVVAKISDFGLSLQMDDADSHISKMFQGTFTHMAPEVLLHGCQSTASDVYAFGITMWELFTSKLAFSDIPSTLLAYQIAHKGCRPDFPADSPSGYVRLALRCWDHNPAARPDFNIILEELRQLRAQESEAATLLMMQKDLVVEVGPSSGSYIAELGSPVRGTFIGGSAILLAPTDSYDED